MTQEQLCILNKTNPVIIKGTIFPIGYYILITNIFDQDKFMTKKQHEAYLKRVSQHIALIHMAMLLHIDTDIQHV